MIKTIQPFSYHTHTGDWYDYHGLWQFDGKTSAHEMITQAEKLGWHTLGISNHMIVNDSGFDVPQPCLFFDNYATATEVYCRLIDDIRAASINTSVRVLVGFEVDYFRDVKWENWFAKTRDKLGADYYIGSTHIGAKDQGRYVFFMPSLNARSYQPCFFQKHYTYYCDTQKAIIASGQFDFLAHFDVWRRYVLTAEGQPFDDGNLCKEQKQSVIDEIIRHQMPVEVNTGAFALGLSEPHPNHWVLQALQQGGVPVVISDDAHRPQDLGRYFEQTENLLSSLGNFQRFQLPEP